MILFQTNEVRQAANNANRKHERLSDINNEVQEVMDDLKDKKNQEQKRRTKLVIFFPFIQLKWHRS